MTQALLIIDVQSDFCPGGALAVNEGDAIVPLINRMQPDFDIVVATQDWHPANHTSFASNNGDAAPFSMTEMPYGPQVLWPDHCVQGTSGASMCADLSTTAIQLIIRKGFRPEIDSYSAFFENDHSTATGLDGYLRERRVSSLVLVGLATDFCVKYSALDAATLGFDVSVVLPGCRAIDLDGSLDAAISEMRDAGVVLQESVPDLA
ncbi:MAG: bifunctional nicotinamidase/pyrazinamidase [Pseudomonadota bacterium]